MPTLVRLLTTLTLVLLVVYGIMAALVHFVEPFRSEVSIEVPLTLEPVDPQGGEGAP